MKGKELGSAFRNSNQKKFKWNDYNWECSMEGGRIIHPDHPYYWFDKKNVEIDYKDKDKPIYLYVDYKKTTITHSDGITYNPYMACGLIKSIEKFSFGTFSCDIKLPKGHKLWPSFWLTGAENWPPEIDICEAWTGDNNYFNLFIPKFPYFYPSWKTTTNVHYLNDDLSKLDAGSHNVSIFKQLKNPTNTFINYKVEWFPDQINFYIDDKLIREIKNEIPQKLVKNLNHPDKDFKMNVVFNVWCENFESEILMLSPMIIKNFKYNPYKK